MPTADRTTIKAAVQALIARLRDELTAEPPTPERPFRRIEEGTTGPDACVRPFLTVRIMVAQPVSATEGDRVIRVTLELRITTDVLSGDPHDAVLDEVGAVDDFFDALLLDEDEIVEGADGFDDRCWTFSYPAGSTAAQSAEATCRQSFAVRIERGANREPAAPRGG